MSEPINPEEISMQNERSLATLIRAIVRSQGRFSLILVRCNYGHLQEQILEHLRQKSQLQILEITLDKSATNLYSIIQAQLADKLSVIDAIMVLGLQSVTAIDDLLISINRVRDDFPQSFSFPVVFWINDLVLQKFVKLAPDFYTYAGVPIKFAIATTELIQVLQKKADSLFSKILETGGDRFLDNTALNIRMDAAEIESALEELHSQGYSEPELEASQQFISGRDAYSKSQMERSRQLYEQSLTFWEQSREDTTTEQAEETALSNSPIPYPLSPIPYPLRQACVLFHLGLWWRRYAVLHRAEYEAACRQAENYYQQCVQILQQANRPDLVAQFINPWGEVLQQLARWDELESVANTAIELHTTYPNPVRLANAYALLAEVALGKSQWETDQQYATRALEAIAQLANEHPEIKRHYQSWYQFLISQAQYHQNEVQAALHNLDTAKEGCKPDYNPQLYIRILNALCDLHYEQHRYLEAFELKQEKRSIEQQYGFRAFIGAGRLQSQRQVIHPALITVGSTEFYGDVETTSQQGTIAQEIVASGREEDVKQLIQRISRDDQKLVVIYGPSGVGKSSLLTAGLLPALQDIPAIDSRIPLPVIVRFYSDWKQELGKVLGDTTIQSIHEILQLLRQNATRNFLTIIIFDQFEEFFFNCSQPFQRKEFWQFLKLSLDSLDIPYVKVILSLREDYLHYLLECDRLTNLEITKNDILNKGIRYYFGNFSPEGAKKVIQNLTERSSSLEPELIDELVRDLAAEEGEVRPIELQVVGSQLETEKITQLKQYQEKGPKEQLVQRYLDEVVKDCGQENESAAQLVLYLLTDENNTRPLKTYAELADALAVLAAEVEKLELVLKILVTSGIVFLIPQSPADRYQLVHDYLVSFIRQQRGAELLAELEREKQKRQLAEAKLNQVLKQRLRIASGAGVGLVALTAVALTFGVKSTIGETNAQISALVSSSEALFTATLQEEALVEAIKAGEKLQQTIWSKWMEARTRNQVVVALRQAVYESKGRELKTLKGHCAEVMSVSFSLNGKTIASASRDNTIKLWDTTGRELTTLKGHSDDVYSVSFSPDGRMIVSASRDNTVKLWDTTGRELTTLKGHSDDVYSVSFSPDGKRIASTSWDNTVKLWDTTGKELTTLKGHSAPVLSVSFSPDSKTIASASWDNTVKLWDTTGRELTTLKGHSAPALSVSFSPDGKTIASASSDNTVKLWDITSFRSDGETIASASWDNTVKLWGTTGRELTTFKGHSDEVWSINFSPDGKTIASASRDSTIKLWDTTGRELKTLKGHSAPALSVSFSPDGKTIASASSDNTVKLWDATGRELTTLKGHSAPVLSVSFSPDGKTIASASRNNTVKLWDTKDRELTTLKGHSDKVWSISFSPDGKTIASASRDNTVKLWDATGRELTTLKGHSADVYGVSFSPDSKTIASASSDNTVKIWDTTGRELTTLKGHSDEVWSINFSPDGKTIASASSDNTVKIWNTTGRELTTLKGHSAPALSVSFSPDGKTIASASWDNTVKLWGNTGRELTTLKGHSAEVLSVSFSPDGKTIASASRDNTVKLWDTTGRELTTLKGHSAPVLSVSFSPDGKTIASASSDETVKLWNLDLENLLELGCDWLQYYLPRHPETLAELPVCQTKSLLSDAASTLVEQGEKLAKEGNFEGAVAKFNKAKVWNSELNYNSEVKSAPAIVIQGIKLAQEGEIEAALVKFKKAQQLDRNIDLNPETKATEYHPKAVAAIIGGKVLIRQDKIREAIALYKDAQKLDPSLTISAYDWNSLCWDGSLRGFAKDVMFACEKAVALSPKDGEILDSRGLARALTGNSKGAIEDFQAFIKSTDNSERKSQRQSWINALNVGKNPFTAEELKRLREE